MLLGEGDAAPLSPLSPGGRRRNNQNNSKIQAAPGVLGQGRAPRCPCCCSPCTAPPSLSPALDEEAELRVGSLFLKVTQQS